MKNALIFFYDIYIDELTKINNNYYFKYQNNYYVIEIFNRPLEEITDIYNLNVEMLNNNIPVYQIIYNKNNSIIFLHEKKNYILMKLPNIKNRTITFEDILNFNYFPANKYLKLDKTNWPKHWQEKIDYIEYQFYHLEKKYPLIRESINYYLGVWENAISYYNDNVIPINIKKVICHKRVTSKSDLLEFYNPLNIIIDTKERELADYIKSYINEEKYTMDKILYFLSVIPKDYNIIFLFISRTLFPTTYFDLYENIIFNNEKEQKILIEIEKRKNYENLLKSVFNYFSDIPSIEWIKKED